MSPPETKIPPTLGDTTVEAKDKTAVYLEKVLPTFRRGEYDEALRLFEWYLQRYGPHLSPKERLTTRANLVACYTGREEPHLNLRSAEGYLPDWWERLWDHVEGYFELLFEADQLAEQPLSVLLGNIVSLALAYQEDIAASLAWLSNRLGERYEHLLLAQIQAHFHRETTNYGRPGHIHRAQALGELYLQLSEGRAGLSRERTAILIRLADLTFFSAEGSAGVSSLTAIGLLDRALREDRSNQFARRLREHIEQREATIQQIARFKHDTGSRLGAVRHAVGELHNQQGLPQLVTSLLAVIERNTRAMAAVQDLVQGRLPGPDQWKRQDPTPTCLRVMEQLGLGRNCLRERGTRRSWELVPDYLALALDNLLKNSLEAYQRRGLVAPEPPLEVLVDHDTLAIEVRDWAGGIDSTLGDVFLPYVSQKGVRQEAGLGLAQARQAMRAQDGDLMLIEPQPAGGAGFRIQLLDYPKC